MKNNKIVYNVIMNNHTKFDIHLAEPGKYMINNICDYNTYIRPDGVKLRLTNGGKGNWKELLVTGDWKQWQKKTGADLNSIFYTGPITTP